ncbi:hypothetical protein RB195_007143 [Necator americanus]|uniref:Metalloendopeptidase n=1 Tax=Necator americanus TaxID=51031 RepID=A0ABR1BVV3_NECAM
MRISHIILLQILTGLHLIAAIRRGPPVNIHTQKGGDIAQLRNVDDEMRNALPPESPFKWDNLQDSDGKFVVPYVISGSYDAKEKKVIFDAMKKIDENTCIRFKPRKSSEEDYVDIQNNLAEGCYTTVGRNGGRSILNLEASRIQSCMQLDSVIHELLHVLGLWHEHMRADRDEYIKVHQENIQLGFKNQFAKMMAPDAATYGVPYDYLSIMHYPKDANAVPGTITIETLDPKYQDAIGKQKEPSKNNYKKICLIYKCSVCQGEEM